MYKYILNGTEVVPEPDTLKWAKWYETADRHVNLTKLDNNLIISTVFLSLDANIGMGGIPKLFETLVGYPTPEGGLRDIEIIRYSTWEEAEEGHKMAVKLYASSSMVISRSTNALERKLEYEINKDQ